MTFPSFFGDSFSNASYEAKALSRIDKDLRNNEADAFGTKWFDYRLWHPTKATYYYTHCYIQAAKTFCARYSDKDKVAALKLFEREDALGTRDFTALTKGRQALDSIGCRYEWGLEFAIERFADRGWGSFPRPNQLYGEELIWDIRDSWNAFCRNSLQLTQSEALQADKTGLVAQEYREWLVGQVRARGARSEYPLSRLLNEGHLSDEQVQTIFGDVVLHKARRVLGT